MGFGLGLGLGIVIIVLITAVIAYVLLQETRAHLHWRGLVAAGDVEAIRMIIEGEMESWRSGRPPKGVPANVWSAVQTAQVIDLGADFVRLSTGVEGQYAAVGGERREVSSPLEEAAKVSMKLAEMMLYDIPNLRLARVQIDIFSTFRDEEERPQQRCILSTVVAREDAAMFDWDGAGGPEFIATFHSRSRTNESGVALPVEPFEGATVGGAGRT